MDTDDLSQMAYECILYANDATDILKSEVGAACMNYKTENDYLEGILKHVTEIEKDPEDYLDGWNLLDQTDIKIFKQRIEILRKHIQKTLVTPIRERAKSSW